MSEKPSIEELARQINSLSKEEKAELAKQLDLRDLKEMIANLPEEKRGYLFSELNVLQRTEYYEHKQQYDKDLQVALKQYGFEESNWGPPATPATFCLIECKFYVAKTFNLILSIECRSSRSSSPNILFAICIPFYRAHMVINHINDIFTIETPNIAQQFVDKIVERLRKGTPEDVDFLKHYENHKANQLHINPQIKERYFKAETIAFFAAYKKAYDANFKDIKADFRTIYNNTDHRLPIRKREEEAKKQLLAKRPDLPQRAIEHIGLNFKPSDMAIILAAQDCYLDPFTKTGKISSHIRNLLTEAKKIDQTIRAEYEKMIQPLNRPLDEKEEKLLKKLYLMENF